MDSGAPTHLTDFQIVKALYIPTVLLSTPMQVKIKDGQSLKADSVTSAMTPTPVNNYNSLSC